MGVDFRAALYARDHPDARFASAEGEALMAAELSEIELLGERPTEEGRIVRGGNARLARVELVPDNARGRFGIDLAARRR